MTEFVKLHDTFLVGTGPLQLFLQSLVVVLTVSLCVRLVNPAINARYLLSKLSDPFLRRAVHRKLDKSGKDGNGGLNATTGEPIWVMIPHGEFWMGGGDEPSEGPTHRNSLAAFHIAQSPITIRQYLLYVRATGAPAPLDWTTEPSRETYDFPVVNVSWYDALKYCAWLSREVGKPIRLPTEAEWEKACRGAADQREFAWGSDFLLTKCNSSECRLGGRTPVGAFPLGASPYGCLDMCGNVFEWTSSLWGEDRHHCTFAYPYDSRDGREDVAASKAIARIVRGGSYEYDRRFARCFARQNCPPQSGYPDVGFRVVY